MFNGAKKRQKGKWVKMAKHMDKSNGDFISCEGRIEGIFEKDRYWFKTKQCHTCSKGGGTGHARDNQPKIQMFSLAPMWNITRDNMRRMRMALKNCCTKGRWGNLPNQGTGRQWLKGIVDIGNQHGDSVRQQIEEMMHPYLDIIKSQYPHLRYWRVGALWTEPNTKSQYEKCGDQLHSDYSEEVVKRDHQNCHMSMIMSLDEDFKLPMTMRMTMLMRMIFVV